MDGQSQFARDGMQRSSARIDSRGQPAGPGAPAGHAPMYHRVKAPPLGKSLADNSNQQGDGGGFSRNYDHSATSETRTEHYENLRRDRENRRPKTDMISPPTKPPRGQHVGRVERPSPSKTSLYRSNSNLDLDRTNNEHNPVSTNLGREYGSTSSLDLLAEAEDTKQSFFAIVRNYKSKNSDRTQTPKLQQLRGQGNGNTSSKPIRPSTIPIPSPVNITPDELDSSPPNKQQKKSKSGRRSSGTDGPSLFQKLRGLQKMDSTELRSPTDSDERVRRKVFVHYDVQSLTFRLTDSNKNSLSGPKRRNTVAGASAASMSIEDQSIDLDDEDEGDKKSNHLLESCSFFRNEISMDDGVLPKYTSSMHHIHRFVVEGRRCYKACRQSICNAVSGLDSSTNSLGATGTLMKRHRAFVIEHADHGATYYRHFFSPYEHQNYFGIDDQLGPVAVSMRREACLDKTNAGRPEAKFQYRIILRTSELSALRGAVAEDSIPSPSRISASRGIPAKDVLDFVCPELNLSNLKLGEKRLSDQLMKLDEMGLSKSYKVGLLLCRQGQNTEEDMYNNESSTPAFDEFLNLLGKRVRLKGFEGFRGGLDTKTDSTGTHSLFTTFLDYEMMFHVGTLLPFTPDDKQQLMRKCHIGNDIVTLVFQEPGALPFSPKTMRSHFQHIFIIVRVNHPCSDKTTYQVAVSRSKEVPAFGPPLPEDSIFPKSQEFCDYLLAKVINGENAVHRSQRFTSMSTRTRQEYLRHLAEESQTGISLEAAKGGKFQSGSGRKKDRNAKNKSNVSDYVPRGGLSWQVLVEDPGIGQHLNAVLAISETMVVLIDEVKRACVFALPCDSIIGWTEYANMLKLYYNHGECLLIRVSPSQQTENDIHDVVQRLQSLTHGAQTSEITLQRNQQGQLGFHVQAEGIVSEVDTGGPAYLANLRTNCRIVEVGKFKTASLSLDQLIDILRAAQQIRVVTVPPLSDGSLRKGCEECRMVFSSQPHYLLPTANPSETDSKSVSSVRSEQSGSDHNTSLQRYNDQQQPVPSPREPERSIIPSSRRGEFEEPQRTAREYRQQYREERYHDYRESRDSREEKREFNRERPEKREHSREERRISREEKKSPRDQYLDVSNEASFESRGSNRDVTYEPPGSAFKDARRQFIPSSPRVTRAPKPTDALRERSFQDELMRLISPDLAERSMAADRAKSEENISKRYSDETSRLSREQRLSPRATAFKSSQNSVFRKISADNPPVPLLENTTSSLDWSHLVDTASRLVDHEPDKSSNSQKNSQRPQTPQTISSNRPDKLSVRAVQTSSPWRDQRSPERRVRDLQQQLEDERRKREQVEVENEELRRENERLQEESQAAAAQLRRFTQWFFSTMEGQQQQHQQL